MLSGHNPIDSLNAETIASTVPSSTSRTASIDAVRCGVAPRHQLGESGAMLRRDFAPPSRARLAIRRPGLIMDAHQTRNRKQRLAGHSLSKLPGVTACVECGAPSSGVSADVAVESAAA